MQIVKILPSDCIHPRSLGADFGVDVMRKGDAVLHSLCVLVQHERMQNIRVSSFRITLAHDVSQIEQSPCAFRLFLPADEMSLRAYDSARLSCCGPLCSGIQEYSSLQCQIFRDSVGSAAGTVFNILKVGIAEIYQW